MSAGPRMSVGPQANWPCERFTRASRNSSSFCAHGLSSVGRCQSKPSQSAMIGRLYMLVPEKNTGHPMMASIHGTP